MRLPRFLSLSLVWFSAAVLLPAQDAQEIIDATSKVYAAATSYSADIDSRTIQLAFTPGPDGETPQYQVHNIHYRRLQMKVRRPYGYLLGAQMFNDGTSRFPSALGRPANMPPPMSSSWSFLSRTDNSLPKQGLNQSGRIMIRDVPAEQFNAMVNARLGGRAASDVVMRHFQGLAVESTGGMALGLIEPAIIGRENRGRSTYRIVAKTTEGHPITLWVEQETFLIVRTIVQRPRIARPPFNGERVPPPSTTGSNMVTAVETFYNNQRIDPSFNSTDFSIPSSAPDEQATAEQMGFSPVADIVKLAEIKPFTGTPSAVDGNESDDSVDATKPAEAENEPVAGQALSYEQMSGIVLIDGDGGTASGFMTKIRDVDFVVTNLHVLVGNKKFTLKTLSGEEIQPLGIFGAVGSDIAIIRIGKGQGDLRLTSDVFKTSKIGDKIVVVGNRRGGGVATQTNGSIKGIGPNLIEVDANFQSGNSGSPIVNLSTNEVIGVATYSETRRVEVDGPASNLPISNSSTQVEKRWFGYRLDSVSKWEAIDLNRWNAQSERLTKFRETSEALHEVIKFEFKAARQHPRLTGILDSFEARYRSSGSNSLTAATEIKDLFRVIRTISDDGMRD
ncbi:MAG: serine protease, partial [Rariglobus sp.]